MSRTVVDVHVRHHGSIALVTLRTRAAREWVEHNGDALYHVAAEALVVEPRYLPALLDGMRADELEVRP